MHKLQFYRGARDAIILTGLFAALLVSRADTLIKTNSNIPEANLAGDLQVLADTDEGIYAFKIRLRNLSATNDVVLKLFDVREQYILFHLFSSPGGKLLEKPLRNLKDYEIHGMEIRLAKSSTIEWFVRVADYVENLQAVPEKTTGGMTAIFGFRYKLLREGVDPGNFENGSLRFMVTPITITRSALQGDPTEKYEKAQKAAIKL